MLKICVIGCGEHSAKVHGPSLARYAASESRAQLSACCDINILAVQSYCQSFGFLKPYTDYIKMLNEINPDAVLMVTPIALTAQIAAELLKRKIPVILEKPAGANKAEALTLSALAKQTQTPHEVAFNRRHMPQVTKLKSLLLNEKINYLHYEMYRVNRLEPFSSTAIHAIDAVRAICAEDYSAVNFTYKEIPGTGAFDIFIDGVMQSGARVRIDICPACGLALERVSVFSNGKAFTTSLPTGAEAAGAFPFDINCFENGTQKEPLSLETLHCGEAFYDCGGFYHEDIKFFSAVLNKDTQHYHSALASSVQSMQIADCVEKHLQKYEADAV